MKPNQPKPLDVKVASVTRYGLKVGGKVVSVFDSPLAAYNAAMFAYRETAVFHEIVMIKE